MEDWDARHQAIVLAACESSPAGCLVADRDGTIVYVNRTVERMFGYERNELLGKSVEQLVPMGREHAHRRARQRFMANASDRPMGGRAVLEGRCKNGALIPLEIGLTPIVDGGESFAIASVVDVSERLEAQRRAEQSEHRASQAQKLEALGNLASGISHDFNNILLAIFGYAELLKASPQTNPQAAADLDAILEAATRGRDLVKRILGFARQSEERREPLQLGIVVGEVRRLLKSSVPRSVTLNVDCDSAAPTVVADETQMHQVVMNLVTNAIAAMPEGGALAIRVEPAPLSAEQAARIPGAKEGLYTRLSVQDTGVGMSEEVQARVFEPFFTTKAEGEGTGIGLAMVHGIVSNSGGFIELESGPAEGTRIAIYLPAQMRDRRTSERPECSVVRFRALWVDDEPHLAALGQRSLATFGFEVSAHTSSLQALEEFKATPDAFDLVVSDNSMPHLSGLDFLGAVHQLRPDVPTLMVSGRGLHLDPAELGRNGVRRVLAKPFSLAELKLMVAELVSGVDEASL